MHILNWSRQKMIYMECFPFTKLNITIFTISFMTENMASNTAPDLLTNVTQFSTFLIERYCVRGSWTCRKYSTVSGMMLYFKSHPTACLQNLTLVQELSQEPQYPSGHGLMVCPPSHQRGQILTKFSRFLLVEINITKNLNWRKTYS